jgi:hypothetical protein
VRRSTRLLAAAAALAACAGLPPKLVILSRSKAFRAQTVAVAALTGDEAKDPQVSRALVKAAEGVGLRAYSLEEADQVLAGAAISLDTVSDPRTLAQIRRSTGADAVVLLSFEAGLSGASLSVLDAQTGDSVMRASIAPRAEKLDGYEETAQSAGSALSALTGRSAAARLDDIPVP